MLVNRVVETYIPLGPIFVYLFAVIDVYSRKIVGWHLGLNAAIDSMKKAWDNIYSPRPLVQHSRQGWNQTLMKACLTGAGRKHMVDCRYQNKGCET